MRLTDEAIVQLLFNGAKLRIETSGRAQDRLVQFCAIAWQKEVPLTLVVNSLIQQPELVQLNANAPGLLTLDFVG